jgi:hypothetical protein
MRALAFGDLESELWGVIWLPGEEPVGVLALRAGPVGSRLDVTLQAGAPEDPWSLAGDGISLEFVPAAGGGRGSDPEGRLTSEDQLCRVTGRARLEDSEVEVSCLGWRSTVSDAAGLGNVESFRFLAGWLEPAFGFSLLALRPGRARGQDADAVAAVVIEDPAPPPVVDPRLSTTYTEAGLPRRAGLELWLEEEDEDAAEDDVSPQYPRRAAGEALGAGLDWSQGDFELHASVMRWHSHGREGPGVYVLGRHQ